MTAGYHPVLQWYLIILFVVTVEGGYLFAHYKLERESTTRRQTHFLRVPRSIANDIKILHDAEQAGAVWVHIRDKETGQIYQATIAHIRESGFPINRGWGNQIAIPMNGWIMSGQVI